MEYSFVLYRRAAGGDAARQRVRAPRGSAVAAAGGAGRAAPAAGAAAAGAGAPLTVSSPLAFPRQPSQCLRTVLSRAFLQAVLPRRG